MARYFIHKGKAKQLKEIAEKGGGYEQVEVMVVMKDVELMVPRWNEEKEEWVEIKLCAMEKLVCDRCGIEYTDKESIDGAKQYQEKWAKLCREDGVEPRGLSACPVITCAGELQLKEV